MQYQVPQFLDVEDKVIGPFTIKQFIYLSGGLGMGYMASRFIPYIGWILAISLVVLGWALAYYKYNGKSFVYMIEAAFNYAKHTRLYIWKRREKALDADLDLSNFKTTKHPNSPNTEPQRNKLSTLSWTLEMKEESEVDELS